MKMCSVKPCKFLSLFSNKGFTLVEMLVAFSIFLIIASFIPLSIKMMIQNEIVDERLQRMEWEVFISQVKKEVRMSDTITINHNRLLLNSNGKNIIYEQYGPSIRRRVDLKGHEIYLQNIKSVTFEKLNQGVKISVQDIYDQNESKIIRTLLRKEEVHAP
ncbi:competence type IV pilus minor pilin ComGF [Niallia sp. Krafla_26]|uniref:competence type IV pilus minor pilin ComGF n=1 Tax=Niallia sp. Krafla_26 TaxID=3064703 RepID=UPI003D17A70F